MRFTRPRIISFAVRRSFAVQASRVGRRQFLTLCLFRQSLSSLAYQTQPPAGQPPKEPCLRSAPWGDTRTSSVTDGSEVHALGLSHATGAESACRLAAVRTLSARSNAHSPPTPTALHTHAPCPSQNTPSDRRVASARQPQLARRPPPPQALQHKLSSAPGDAAHASRSQ